MTAYVALLRAVNVGGTGKLPMTELKSMCEAASFADVQTYIASGNVVFTSVLAEAEVRTALEERLAAYAGKPVGILVRTAAEMADTHARNPFADQPGNRVTAIFVDEAIPEDAADQARNVQAEKIRVGRRELFVFYGDGMADSRLIIPAAKAGTARNMNTVAKLAELALALR